MTWWASSSTLAPRRRSSPVTQGRVGSGGPGRSRGVADSLLQSGTWLRSGFFVFDHRSSACPPEVQEAPVGVEDPYAGSLGSDVGAPR